MTAAGALNLGGLGLLTVAFPFFAADELGVDRSVSGYMWAAFAARLDDRRAAARAAPDPLAAGARDARRDLRRSGCVMLTVAARVVACRWRWR